MTRADRNAIDESYREHAEMIGQAFLSVDPAAFLQPVADHLPQSPTLVLDAGAGSGRDAAWFVSAGHSVVAVEPVAELADQGRAHAPEAEWHVDSLPALAALAGREGTFGLIWLCAVWHHLDEPMRDATLARFRALAKPGGRLVLSLRQTDDVDHVQTFPADPEPAIDAAAAHGFTVIHQAEADSQQTHNQDAGVRWHWLVFELAGSAT